ncbi:hypothetical protein [Pontibacter lucknowensis]|uniref:Uncharacterized protein n=1 Tax=Pontibacter lucknowensis TaxID=1077936 RepID=A0A1N6TZS0_9BACT|nr:hypothetical protein [Pontibacter lucknowensis]SIQ58862.1 hypothetical protein SAMN05421545_0599 [Pontibacter lucknowensis]
MRRHRRSYLSGLFFNTGNYDVPTVDTSFGFSRQFTDTVSQGLMDDERVEREHQKEDAEKELDQRKTDQENPEL